MQSLKRTSYECDICGHINKTRTAKKEHLKVKHNYENNSPFCKVCNQYFKNEYRYNKHRETLRHMRRYAKKNE